MFKGSQTERVLSFEHTSTATSSSPGSHSLSGEVHLTPSSSSSSTPTRGSSEVELFAYVFPGGLLGRWVGRCLRLRVGRFQCTVEGPHSEKKGGAPLPPPRAGDALSREDFSSSSSFRSAQEAPFLGVRVVEVEADSVVPEMEVLPPSHAWRKKFAQVEKQREKQKEEERHGHPMDASRSSPFSSTKVSSSFSSSSSTSAEGKWRQMANFFRRVPNERAPPPQEMNGTKGTKEEGMHGGGGLRVVPLSAPASSSPHDAEAPPRATPPAASSSRTELPPTLSPPLFPPRVPLTYSERNKVQKRLLSSTVLHADRFPLIWYDIEEEDGSSLTGELYVKGVGQPVRCHKFYTPSSSAAALPPLPPPLSTTTTTATSSSPAIPVEGSSATAGKEKRRISSVPPPRPHPPVGDGFLHIYCSIPDIEAYGITKPSLWMRLFTISSTVEVEAKIPIDINLS